MKLFSSIDRLSARGKQHFCFKTTAVANIVEKATSLGEKSSDQVISKLLKLKMTSNNYQPGQSFFIGTEGKPLSVTVGQPDNKRLRSNFTSKISLSLFKELQLGLDLSKKASRKFISTINKGLGRRKNIAK